MLVHPALLLARLRHVALANEDFEAYAAADAEMVEHCSRLGALARGVLSIEDRAALDELLALEQASSRMLNGMTSVVSGRLALLAARSRTNAAYLRAERSSVIPL